MKCRIVSSKDRKNEQTPRFGALFSTQGGPFRLLLPLPCPPSPISPEEGLPGGLIAGSSGRNMRRSLPNRLLNVDMYAAYYSVSNCKNVVIQWRRKVRFGRVAKRAPACSLSATRATQRAPESQTGKTGRISWSQRSCKRSTCEGIVKR